MLPFKIILLLVFCLYASSCARYGCIKGNCYYSQGTYVWPNGEKYVGEFKDGKSNGQGTFTWANGKKYVGGVKDNKFHGQGTITVPNGEKYVGEFKDDKFHGQGTLTWPNGEKYVGEFKDYEFHGWGTYTFTSGIKYVGEWKDGKKHGQGTITVPNGEKYVGEFKDDKRHGWGLSTQPDGTSSIGKWENDKFVKALEEIFVKYEKTENEFRQYFKGNLSALDNIEGIWSLNLRVLDSDGGIEKEEQNQAIVAIIRNTASLESDFLEVILSNEMGFIPQTVAAYFKSTAYNGVYVSRQIALDGTSKMRNFIIEESGILRSTKKYEDYYDEIYYVKLFPILAESETSEELISSIGSGLLLTQNGLIVTNYHVVEGGTSYEVVFPTREITKKATIKIKDARNDIAILEIKNFRLSDIVSGKLPFNLARNSSVKIGQEVFTLGFPLSELLGKSAKLSTGTINSLSGLGDDPRLLQISNPIQPGNSGGPLFNRNGELVGIVVASINAKYLYEKVGIIPQNVNFAIKIDCLKNLIELLPEAQKIINRSNRLAGMTLERQVEVLTPFIVRINIKQ